MHAIQGCGPQATLPKFWVCALVATCLTRPTIWESEPIDKRIEKMVNSEQ